MSETNDGLNPALLLRLKLYERLTGASVGKSLDEAVSAFLETTAISRSQHIGISQAEIQRLLPPKARNGVPKRPAKTGREPFEQHRAIAR